MEISVVIPTYNRQESLDRLLTSLSAQQQKPLEVIIIDGGSEKIAINRVRYKFPNLEFVYDTSPPSVCIQRNAGILLAKGSHVFLCDDDIELSADYILKLAFYLKQNPSVGIVTGSVLQKNAKGIWVSNFPLASFGSLCWKFIFQQSIWINLESISTNFLTKIPYRFISNFYKKRNNTFSLAGWPVITEFSYPVYTTSFYGIGASLINKEWLLNSPYDETLDNYGIGDHYGILCKVPEFPGVHVNTETYAFHHKNTENRLPDELVYYRRVLALHYFMRNNKRFSYGNRLWLLWSLVGNGISQIRQTDGLRFKASIKLIWMIIANKNPYVLASLRKEKTVCPIL